MTSAADIARLARVPTTTVAEAASLIEQYAKVEVAKALAEEARQALADIDARRPVQIGDHAAEPANYAATLDRVAEAMR